MKRFAYAAMAALTAAAICLPAQGQNAPAGGGVGAGAPAANAPAAGRGGRGGGGGAAPILSYVFKPKDIGYTAPNKPVWHIADILAAHKGQTDWEHPVLKDPWFFIQYISMGAGKKTAVSMQSDTIIWFIINSGQVRFHVQGQEPIVAGVDSMVSIPARIPYSIETVGNAPSIRFEVRNAHAGTVFPVADNPAAPVAPPGFETVQVNCSTCAPPAGARARFFDYGAWAKANPTSTQRPPFPDTNDNWFVRDANGFMTMARSVTGTPIPPPDVIGHFHMALAEWWYVLEGDMATRIEGVGDVFAKHGDFIYSPQGAYHQTIMTGAPSTRTPAGKTGVMDQGAGFSKPGAAAGN